jgi:hypothetical protein
LQSRNTRAVAGDRLETRDWDCLLPFRSLAAVAARGSQRHLQERGSTRRRDPNVGIRLESPTGEDFEESHDMMIVDSREGNEENADTSDQ